MPYGRAHKHASSSPPNMGFLYSTNAHKYGASSWRGGADATAPYAFVEMDNIGNFIKTKLRSLITDVPLKEKDIQNAVEFLFIGRNFTKGIDYDRESGKFNFSGREYIPDFILPKLRTCIEVKLLKEPSKRSKVIEEINADITAYSKEYDTILFVVYDVGIIRDEVEFCRDIENITGVRLIIVKH
ncbi:hypothetical protein ACFPPD_02140 [Cohnella suwonensis]|uniref:Uncharacterized protein n=1 Tax=Cohnella suwonensis TaxID=696072 RepID=A0ABW0LQF4_9BACL